MKTKRIVLATTMAVTAIAASFLLIAALASAKEVARYPAAEPLSPNQLPPVTFPRGDWPWYAQEEITVDPEPPIAHHPTKLCAWVVSNDPVNLYTVTLEFSVANFGISVPFTRVGMVDVMVPAGSHAMGCVVWTPPEPGHWCMQAVIHQGKEYPPAIDQFTISQRNIDIWEPLVPGEEHQTQFPVGPLPDGGRVSLDVTNYLGQEGWEVWVSTSDFTLDPGETRMVTLTTMPPPEVLLGSRRPVADVEGRLNGELPIGGFRKYDWPPVPLHQPQDPPYAESEIYVQPYPPRAGEPTQICVELYNLQEVTRTVQLQFSWANFGIGLPFQPINGPITRDIPPHGRTRVCINWVPPLGGHFCVQAQLRTIDLYQKVQYEEQVSQRNIDVDEPLRPGEPHQRSFPVGNPFEHPVTITLGLIPHLPDWGLELSQDVLPDMGKDEIREVILTVTPPEGQPLPEDDTPIVDVEAYVEGKLIGGFRKIFRSPVPVHQPGEPTYGESEISVDPYPPRANEPTKICAKLRNYTGVTQTVEVQFDVAHFGIGLPFMPIAPPMTVELPPYGEKEVCVNYIFTYGGHFCVQVRVQAEGYREVVSQRNLDVDEVLEPGQPDCFEIPIGNPYDYPVTITLGLIGHIPGWEMSLSPDVLPNVQPTPPDPPRLVTLCVTPTGDVANLDNDTPVVDVEAYVGDRLIGGIRKNFRLPVPVHHPGEPPYGESEISVDPYPPRANEPTKICAKLRNYTGVTQTVEVQFDVANFGIGLPFVPIGPPMTVELPPYSEKEVCVNYVFSYGGHFCVQVRIQAEGYREVVSQRNLDVAEILEPGQPDCFEIPVGNPFDHPVTITLGLIGHIPGWEMSLSPDVLPNVQPGQIISVTLCVTPTGDVADLDDDTPVVDVEAYVDGRLIGGIRKNFRLPVPVHRPKDPVYAESEIGVDPYPVVPGQPVKLSVELHNPTPVSQMVTATFSIANFGIGLPFTTSHITPNPIRILIPAHSAVLRHVWWAPPFWEGKFCVRVTLESEGHKTIWSQRNIDVGEPLRRGQPHSMTFPVGSGPHEGPVTVTLGLINHLPGWGVDLSSDSFFDVFYDIVVEDEPVDVTLIVTPPLNAPALGTGKPIVDVEAYVDGELIGGFRKLDVPPIDVHKPHEKSYAETELSVDPDPPKSGQEAQVCSVIQNTSSASATATLTFGWADFGMGIPFTITGMTPPTRTVALGANLTDTACVTWTPTHAGHQCIQVKLTDPAGNYEPRFSQRNVDVEERPPCGETKTFTFTVYNDSPFTVTVDIGLITFNVPPDWKVTIVPSQTLELGPFSEGVIMVIVEIPCPSTLQAMRALQEMSVLQDETGDVPIIDVEGYVDGELVGGIEIQFTGEGPGFAVYLPVILRNQ
jgi:hypothetical protein